MYVGLGPGAFEKWKEVQTGWSLECEEKWQRYAQEMD